MPKLRKVLLVDDASLARALVKRMLPPQDFVVTEASSAAEAVAVYKASQPDIILCDLLMPGESGFDLISQLKKIDPGVKVIVCSADIQTTSHDKALSTGAVGFVTKPIIPALLLNEINRHCPFGSDGGKSEALPLPFSSRLDILSAEQREALVEIIQIGMGKAAANLSQMINKRVDLAIPELDIKTMAEFVQYYAHYIQGDAVAISQKFQGQFSGDALLLFPKDSSERLVKVFLEYLGSPAGQNDETVLGELGNIMINACVGTFGNILKSDVNYTSPSLAAQDTKTLVTALCGEGGKDQYGLIIKTEFAITRNQIHCYLLLVFSFESIDFLRKAVSRMLKPQ